MQKIVEMKQYEDEFDDNYGEDFDENGVDVLSGSCRRFICKFFRYTFHGVFLNICKD